MSAPSPCPTCQELEQLLCGLLPASAAGRMEQHLEACEHCLLVVDELRVDSRIMERLVRLQPTASDELHPDLRVLMRQLEDLGQTVPLSGDDLSSGGPVSSNDFPFLGPAERPTS